ncbi:unnamed protein product [Clonostachys rosea]|uniref:Aminoglycoside phosphotransferase domain-containing protein n=1 Tax=Bionectria ochroleuca TaxID=29856 RepID=A0ABY6UAF0_BIOOC|nr:unnamed protein product [Clonostachys rosea]
MQMAAHAPKKQWIASKPDDDFGPANALKHSALNLSDNNLSAQTDNPPSAEPISTPLEVAKDYDGLVAALRAHRTRIHERRAKTYNFHDEDNLLRRCFPYPPEKPKVWVKYDNSFRNIRREADIQTLVHEHLKNVHAVRIPKVLAVHYVLAKIDDSSSPAALGRPAAMNVMEYVPGTKIGDALKRAIAIDKASVVDGVAQTRLEDEFNSRIGDAIVAMALVSPAVDQKPAPPCGGRTMHEVWGDSDTSESQAPREFMSVQDLENEVNKVVQKVLPSETARADFSAEPLRLCYGGIRYGNFLVDDISDPKSIITIVDFEHTNWLPVSFLYWELQVATDDVISRAVHKKLSPHVEPNQDNIKEVNFFSLARRNLIHDGRIIVIGD